MISVTQINSAKGEVYHVIFENITDEENKILKTLIEMDKNIQEEKTKWEMPKEENKQISLDDVNWQVPTVKELPKVEKIETKEDDYWTIKPNNTRKSVFDNLAKASSKDKNDIESTPAFNKLKESIKCKILNNQNPVDENKNNTSTFNNEKEKDIKKSSGFTWNIPKKQPEEKSKDNFWDIVTKEESIKPTALQEQKVKEIIEVPFTSDEDKIAECKKYGYDYINRKWI